ncbi:hypothetical protein F1559_003436 [Cyanidiococcus yangmingshanensis]|uniref:Uncharacterized protein n=1 Tax=Cyanidiococcus yangmingshanensis TaxID=2690220 RepID=A0A7J7ICE3_9RHOD|nr:hypothetical protein F1559_003436 [Cyanidiococcus yangmingshanensis]
MTQDNPVRHLGHQGRGRSLGRRGHLNGPRARAENWLPRAPPRDAPQEVLATYLAERRQRWPRLTDQTSSHPSANTSFQDSGVTAPPALMKERAVAFFPEGGGPGDCLAPECTSSLQSTSTESTATSVPKTSVGTRATASKQTTRRTRAGRRAETRPTALFRALLEPDARLEERQRVLLECLEYIARERGWIASV